MIQPIDAASSRLLRAMGWMLALAILWGLGLPWLLAIPLGFFALMGFTCPPERYTAGGVARAADGAAIFVLMAGTVSGVLLMIRGGGELAQGAVGVARIGASLKAGFGLLLGLFSFVAFAARLSWSGWQPSAPPVRASKRRRSPWAVQKARPAGRSGSKRLPFDAFDEADGRSPGPAAKGAALGLGAAGAARLFDDPDATDWQDHDALRAFDDDYRSSTMDSSLSRADWGSGLDAFHDHVTNPATGLPMVGGIGGLDVAGNPYGFSDWDHSWHSGSSLGSSDDWHRHDSWSSGSSWDDWDR